MQELQIVEGADEFSFGDGPTGALLVHGFTGSPYSMRGLGEHLAANGISVHGLRLPGHATDWRDLNTKTSSDWQQAVDEAFETFAQGRERVFLVALSFGAALSLDFAARHPDRVAGLVLLAPFLRTNDPLRFLLPVMAKVLPAFKAVGNDIAEPGQDELCYDRLPLRAAVHVMSFCRKVEQELHKVTAPTLLMHSRNDHTSPASNSQLVHDGISSTDKELVWYDRSYHVITMDYDRDDIFRRTTEFIQARKERLG